MFVDSPLTVKVSSVSFTTETVWFVTPAFALGNPVNTTIEPPPSEPRQFLSALTVQR